MPRPSQAKEKRAELIPVVARAFAELGYRGATTAELARRCGVRENILYRLWPDKKAMFIAAIDYVYDLSESIWGRMLLDAGPKGSAQTLLAYEARHHGEFGMYRIVFAGLSETGDAEIRQALRRMYARFQQFIAERIREHRGGARRGVRPDLAAWAIIGLGTIANIGRDVGFLSAAERRQVIAAAGLLLLDGAA